MKYVLENISCDELNSDNDTPPMDVRA